MRSEARLLQRRLKTMRPTGRYEPLFVVLLAVLGLAVRSHGACSCEVCGFTGGLPPCYDIVFTDVWQCQPDQIHPFNDTYKLTYYKRCWWTSDPNCDYYIVLKITDSNTYVSVNWTCTAWGDPNCYFVYEGPRNPCGSGDNENTHDSTCQTRSCYCGYDGSASWSPDWCASSSMDITVETPCEKIYYGNKDCCPTGLGDITWVYMSCTYAECVTTEVKVEVKSLSGWTTAVSPPVDVDVEEEDDCAPFVGLVAFWITTDVANWPTKYRVKCKATFENSVGSTASETKYIYVDPHCHKCCKKSSCPGVGLL